MTFRNSFWTDVFISHLPPPRLFFQESFLFLFVTSRSRVDMDHNLSSSFHPWPNNIRPVLVCFARSPMRILPMCISSQRSNMMDQTAQFQKIGTTTSCSNNNLIHRIFCQNLLGRSQSLHSHKSRTHKHSDCMLIVFSQTLQSIVQG